MQVCMCGEGVRPNSILINLQSPHFVAMKYFGNLFFKFIALWIIFLIESNNEAGYSRKLKWNSNLDPL